MNPVHEGDMTERRFAYSRKQVALLLNVSERTLIRWQRAGLPPRSFQDPTDPLKRCYYDRKEIDRLSKRIRRRKSGARVFALEGNGLPFDPDAYEPAVPGPVAASVYQLLADGIAIDEICRRTGVAPEHVVRLDRLRREFEAQRAGERTNSAAALTRIVIDDDDPELAEWGKDLDERGRNAPPESCTSIFDVDEDDDAPDSKAG